MATLETLKHALRQKAEKTAPAARQQLSDEQYDATFSLFRQSGHSVTYEDFIIPQLCDLLIPLFKSRIKVSILEIGPGPKSVLGNLPMGLRGKIRQYTAFEPRALLATRLSQWLHPPLQTDEIPFPELEAPPNIHQIPFNVLDGDKSTAACKSAINGEKYDVVLFCHSLYGLKPPRQFIESALDMLVEKPANGMVVLFHREGILDLSGLACHKTAIFPTGAIQIANDDDTLDSFASFIAGFNIVEGNGIDANKAIQSEWRKTCRNLGRHCDSGSEKDHYLWFSAPEFMVAFNRGAFSMLKELAAANVPLKEEDVVAVKNREARLRRPAAVARPTNITQVQECIRQALKHGVGITVLGGGHSGHCLWSNVVAIDMGAFNKVHVIKHPENGTGAGERRGSSGNEFENKHGPLIVAEAGCKTGDIIREAMAAGLTVPLGARPSVGAGLWLQGGIGHLARLHGLGCDAIVGAVLVDVVLGRVLVVGRVPSQYLPTGAGDVVRPDNESELMWALKGAGTNFGVVISVVFEAHEALIHTVRNWVFRLGSGSADDPNRDDNKYDDEATEINEANKRLRDFQMLIASDGFPRQCSMDAYAFWDNGSMCLGITMIESSNASCNPELPSYESVFSLVGAVLGPSDTEVTVDGVGLFETEMYMSGMHGGHGGGKTSAFKRCIFLKDIGSPAIVRSLVKAIRTRPSPLCYLHLLHGGGAVAEIAGNTTAFGCRNWDFACVITGVWPRDQDQTEVARNAMQWVYDVAGDMLPLGKGVYGADLGRDPRDAVFAAHAFGTNMPRLARLKRQLDPYDVLAYACPLPKILTLRPWLIILVTGEHCAGKDFCAPVWASRINDAYCQENDTKAHVSSISDVTKKEYAESSGADFARLLNDRAYKEQHRSALTAFFNAQLERRPRLGEEHFLELVYAAESVDVLLITGLREEAPVAALSHLVPDRKLIEVRVQAQKRVITARRGDHSSTDEDGTLDEERVEISTSYPDFIFNNASVGDEAAKKFADTHLLPLFHKDLQRLSDMIRPVPHFPRRNINFHHVLGISQQQGGLALCTSLMQTHFVGNWDTVGAVVCCEAGGFVYASALALKVGRPLALIREAGKLPPPTIAVTKPVSHISSATTTDRPVKAVMIEMERDVVPRNMPVVVVDDVLATGETLCAILELLKKVGVRIQDIHVIVIVEFPVHRGRDLLYRRGFGGVTIRSLLVSGDA